MELEILFSLFWPTIIFMQLEQKKSHDAGAARILGL